jgi:hypothetical protein
MSSFIGKFASIIQYILVYNPTYSTHHICKVSMNLIHRNASILFTGPRERPPIALGSITGRGRPEAN